MALYLRCHGEEFHPNENVYDHEDSEIKNPIRAAFRKDNRWALLSTSLTPMLWAAGFYISFVWMAIYMAELLDPPVKNAFWVNAAAMFCGMTFMLPLAGSISDKVGRTKTMTCSASLLAVVGPIMVILIAQSNSVLAFFAQVVLGVLLSFFAAPLCAWLVENYTAEVRLTSASLGYDIAHATAGGFSPAMATALADGVGVYSPGILYPIFAIVSLIGIFVMHRRGNNKEMESDGGAATGRNPAVSIEEASAPAAVADSSKGDEVELPALS